MSTQGCGDGGWFEPLSFNISFGIVWDAEHRVIATISDDWPASRKQHLEFGLLMAAAPELLSALMAAVDSCDSDPLCDDWVPAAKAAIAKAKGQSTWESSEKNCDEPTRSGWSSRITVRKPRQQ